MPFTDLHLHLLPGVDDGPADDAASIEHAARLARDGVHEATVTPHVGHPAYPLDPRTVPDRTARLQELLDREGIPVRLHPGGELHPDVAGRLGAAELDAVAHGPPGARWVLAEVPFAGIDDGFLDACRAIRGRGFAVVIAHPERAAGLLDGGLERLAPELLAGSVLQVNVCSLLGLHGPEARAGGERLIREGLAYVLASDGHGGRRAHTLATGFGLARVAGASHEHARRLTQANPRFLLCHGLRAGGPEVVTGRPLRPPARGR